MDSSAQTGLIDAGLLDRLPCKLALEWPGGRIGAAVADVRLKLHDLSLLVGVARGQIGHLADAYVRGRVDIEGSLADLMSVAAHLAGDPVKQGERKAFMSWYFSLVQ